MLESGEPLYEFEFEANGVASIEEVAPASCTSLVVCCGEAPALFAQIALKLQPVPWSLLLSADTIVALPPRSPVFSVVCAAEHRIVFVEVQGWMPSEFHAAFVSALLRTFTCAKDFIVLDRIYRSDYQVFTGEMGIEEPHLSGIWTAAWESTWSSLLTELTQLQLPGEPEGFGGPFLRHCSRTKTRCLVAFAMQVGELGPDCVRAYDRLAPVFKQLGILSACWEVPDYAVAMRGGRPKPSSLYA